MKNKVFYFAIAEIYKCGDILQGFEEIAFLTKKQAKNYMKKHLMFYPFKNAKVVKINIDNILKNGFNDFYFYNLVKHQKNEIINIDIKTMKRVD